MSDKGVSARFKINEDGIMAQDGDYWVARDRSREHGGFVYSVVRNTATHGVTDSTYDDLSLALARMLYLGAKAEKRTTRSIAKQAMELASAINETQAR